MPDNRSIFCASVDQEKPPDTLVKVSIVLPTFNHLEFLPQAVKGILNQRFGDFELIIVNDGSTDRTAEYLATLSDPRIKVISRENGGLPSALNCGFAAAKGKYHTWTSADNVVGPTWLEQLVSALDQAPSNVGFAYSAFSLIDVEGNLQSVLRVQDLYLDSLISHNPGIASFLYRADVAKTVGCYDETLLGAEDWDMWLRILEVSDAVYVDDLLYYYRWHSNTMTSMIPDKVGVAVRSTLEKLRQRHGGRFNLDRIYPQLQAAEDVRLARWQARNRLAASLVDSPYCPSQWTIDLMIESLAERYVPELFDNLVHVFCRCGEWDMALQWVDSARQNFPDPKLETMRLLLVNRDLRILQFCPIYQMPRGELSFKLGHADDSARRLPLK